MRAPLGVLFCALLLAGEAHAQSAAAHAPATSPRRFFLVLRSADDVSSMTAQSALLRPQSLRATLSRWGAEAAPAAPASLSLRKGVRELDRYLLVTVPRAGDLDAAMTEAGRDPYVEFVEPEHFLHVDAAAPNDSAWASQWGTQRIGALAAWDATRGDASVVIGIIDTGTDWAHPDLRTQLWINTAEDANRNGRYDPWPVTETRNGVTGDFDGIDNDGNGYVDDVTGYDFVDEAGAENAAGGDYRDPDPDITDEMGHGTSVAGIIGAATDNSIGIAGIAPGCRMMTLRAFDARGVGGEGDVARALAYAIENGARIINMSFGDVQYSRVLRDVVRWAYNEGAVMAASSGNSQSDALHYPSAYDETISVGATLEGDGLAGFSNYGATLDVVAPGVDITTTEMGGGYGSFNGTSASAPFVTAAAALVRSLHPAFTPEEVRGVLIASATDLGTAGWDARFGAGLIDAGRAVQLDAPSVVRILSPKTDQGIRSDSIVITGTAASPVMTGYAVQYGTGANPSKWTDILPYTQRQTIADTLAVWHVTALRDTTYTIRLTARSNKGITLEDRVVITLSRQPVTFTGVGFVPSIDGRGYGVAAGFITDKPSLGKVWFRRKNSGDDWQWVSAEGSTVNNLFISTTHSTYIGDDRLTPGTTYEFYFSATDAGGFESSVAAPTGNFEYTPQQPVPSFGFHRKPYALGAARLFDRTTDFNGNGRPELLCNPYAGDGGLRIMEHDGSGFASIGGTAQGIQYPRGAGDITGDGRAELLTSYVRRGFVYTSDAVNTVPSRLTWADSSSNAFWPMGMTDIDGDGTQEVLAVVNDSTVGVFRSDASGVLTRWGGIVNPTSPPTTVDPVSGRVVTGRNEFSAARFAAGDFNRNGKKDLLFGDADGDFWISEFRQNGEFQTIWISENDYIDGSDFVAAGDFNNDGRDEFAFGVRTTEDDVIPFWHFGIYSLSTQNRATELWSANLHGVGESSQYGSFTRISNSLTAGNLDADPEPELVITAYPELYVVDWNRAASAFAPVFSLPLVNTNTAVIGDFDGNGIPEFAVATPDSTEFWERDLPDSGPSAPRMLTVQYASPRQIRLSWTAEPAPPLYRVYKGPSADSLTLFTESDVPMLGDFGIVEGRAYVYAVTSVDSSRTPVESPRLLSRTFHPHAQPAADTAWYTGGGQVRVHVTQDLATAIPSLTYFPLNESRLPESVALLDRRTLLLTYSGLTDPQYGLRIRGLRDGEGIPFLDLDIFPILVKEPEAPRCYIERVTFVPPRSFDVLFSGAVDPATAATGANYTITPLGSAETAAVDAANPALVHITLGAGAPIGAIGREYVLKVAHVRCADGSLIDDGPGSTAGIVLNRQSLDEMFVFPNPLRPEDAQEFITFANLTPRAVIRIYSLAGAFIREVAETDGNGGTEWNLTDDRGQRVPSGVYVYYATGTDALGRAVEPKTGKFALAR